MRGTLRGWLEGGNYSVVDRVLYKLRVGGDTQLFHEPGFVKPNGPVGDLQVVSDLFEGAPFCQHLEDFPLPAGELFGAIQRPRVAEERFFHGTGDLRSYVRNSLYYVPDRPQQLGGLRG